jgi:DUF4097 and DUF4098 domain-containing protein YvlB
MREPASVIMRIAGVVAAALALAACDITIGVSDYSVREEKRFAVTGATRLSLTTFDGSIEVRGWDRNEVVVEVEKRGPDQETADKIQVKATQDGNVITIDVPKPSPLATTGFRRTPSANFVVSVPLQTAVVARSGDGAVTIRRVDGSVDADTEDGRVRVEEVKGNVSVRTGDGTVEASQITGALKIRTGDGGIRADGVLTGLELETRDGSIEFKARPGSVAESDWAVTTGDGSVRLDLPDGFNVHLDAQAADGRVRVDRVGAQDAGAGGSDERERGSFQGALGTGGKALRIRSGSGSITVKVW